MTDRQKNSTKKPSASTTGAAATGASRLDAEARLRALKALGGCAIAARGLLSPFRLAQVQFGQMLAQLTELGVYPKPHINRAQEIADTSVLSFRSALLNEIYRAKQGLPASSDVVDKKKA